MKKNIFFALLIFPFHYLIAVTAFPEPIVFTQPNGDTLTIQLKGDEFANYATTLDGYTLLYNNQHYFTYALQDEEGDLVPSRFIAHAQNQRTLREQKFLKSIQKNLQFSDYQKNNFRQIRNMVNNQRDHTRAFPTLGNRKLVCILMQTPDRPFVKTKNDFFNLFNQIGYNAGSATGSVKDFFLECSYNQFNLTVDVFGPYTASENMDYYAGSGGSARDLAYEGVFLGNQEINFSDYDNDGDGNLDGLYMIFSGHGEEAGGGADCIWSHAWSIPNTTLDGVHINSYACSPELRGAQGNNITYIGVICHEFGHSLGAPDYYDTDYETGGQFEGTGTWDLQGSGSWNNSGRTPAHPNPRSKVYTYQWASATVLNTPQEVVLPPSSNYRDAFYRINTSTADEYYILENRQQYSFDAAIPHHGMMIYHCAADVSNGYGGINAGHPERFYPVAANANQAIPSGVNTYGHIETESCPWPGTAQATSFSDNTVPSMQAWNGSNTYAPISDITEQDDIIHFNFKQSSDNNTFRIFLPTIRGVSCALTQNSSSIVNAGSDFSFTITLEDAYSNSTPIVRTNGNILTPTSGIYTIQNIQDNQVISISGININTFSVTAHSDPFCNISPEGISMVNYNQNITYIITPVVGYDVANVLVDGINMGAIREYTFEGVVAEHSIDVQSSVGSPNIITVTPSPLYFTTPAGTTSETQSILVNANEDELTINILARVPSEYEISTDENTWKKSIVIHREDLPQILFIRYKPNSEIGKKDSLSVASIGALTYATLFGNVPSGIEMENLKQNIEIFPNPCQNVLNIKYKDAIDNNITCTITDIYGKEIDSFKLGKNETEWNIEQWNCGVYFITLSTSDGTYTQKIIKQ